MLTNEESSVTPRWTISVHSKKRRSFFWLKWIGMGSYYSTNDDDVNNCPFSYMFVGLWPVSGYCTFIESSIPTRVIT